MKMKIIKLEFTSPLHVGEIGLGLEECSPIVHSDTIFNALINAYSLMHTVEETNEFIKEFENVKISSAYPYYEEEIYFPKPRVRLNYNGEIPKEWKKIEFILKEYFEKIIHYEELNETEIEKIVEKKEIYKEHQIPKVCLDRESKISNFFFVSLIEFKENGGLWFTVECEDDVYKEIISCLRLLEDEGFGGKRTWSYGLFKFREENIDLRLPSEDLYMLLSLFYPSENEKELFSERFSEKASWDFVLRGGWIENKRKTRIRMIKEGSVFEKMPQGKILTFNNYCVYGKAFSINIKSG